MFFSPNPSGPNSIHCERDEYHSNNNDHYSISSKSAASSRQSTETPIPLNNETQRKHLSLSPSSKVKWIDAVRTVTQLNQVRKK